MPGQPSTALSSSGAITKSCAVQAVPSAGPISIPELTDEEIGILQTQAAIPIMSDRGITPGIKRDLEGLSGRPFAYLLQHIQDVKKHSTPHLPCFTLAMQRKMRVYMHLVHADALPEVLPAEPWHDLLCDKLMILASLDTYHETNLSKWRINEPLATDTHARYLRWIAREIVPVRDPLSQALVGVSLAQFTSFVNLPDTLPDLAQQCRIA